VIKGQPAETVAAWQAVFSGIPPAGYLVRDAHPKYWVRFHTMPQNRRLPKSPTDNEVVLYRLNKIADTLFVAAAEVSILVTVFDPDDAILRILTGYRLGQVTLIPKEWLSMLEEYVDTSQMTIWASAIKWKPGCINDLFLAKALDTIGSLTMFAPELRTAMCPYDGGVDTFVPSSDSRSHLRQKFGSWLPNAQTPPAETT